MTRADFRALRERVGHSQQSLADALGVSVRAVKKWEHESGWDAPDDAWELLEAALDTQRRMCDCVLDTAHEQAESLGDVPCVAMTYYRDQAMFDEFGRDAGYFGVANANSRAAAMLLEREGYDVEMRYPVEDAIPTPGSGY